MKKIIATAVWLGIVTYCLLSILVGPTGIKAMRTATKATASMYTNLDELKAKNEAFTAELQSLSHEPASIALEARSLGYLEDDEVVIRLKASEGAKTPADPGQRLSFEPLVPCADTIVKAIALSVAAAYAGVAILFSRLRHPSAYRDRRVQEAART